MEKNQHEATRSEGKEIEVGAKISTRKLVKSVGKVGGVMVVRSGPI